MWNPRVEAILAERRAAAAPQQAESTRATSGYAGANNRPAKPDRQRQSQQQAGSCTGANRANCKAGACSLQRQSQLQSRVPAPVEPEPTTAPAPAPVELTAEFRNVPTTHNGSDPFTMELHFSEDIPELGYRTVRDTALEATNGRITKAKRHTSGSNQAWNITVQPASRQAVEIGLYRQRPDCTAAGAICVDERMMSSNLFKADCIHAD